MEALNNFKDSFVAYISDYAKNFSSARLFVLFGSFISGLLFGFVLNNYGRQLLFLMAFLGASVFLLNYFHFATVHTVEIKAFFGITGSNSVQDVFYVYVDYIKKYMVESVFFLIGFLIGWKIG